MNRPLIPAVLVLAWLLAACGSKPTPSAPSTERTRSAPLSQQLTLSPGQSADVPGTALRLRFEGVASDSRCPADALCVQLGEAVAVFDASIRGDGASRVSLTTGSRNRARVGAYSVELEHLLPYPFSSRPIDPADYRATLIVQTD